MPHYANTNHKGQEQAQKEHPEGHHATPASLIVALFNWLDFGLGFKPEKMLDPGAGNLGGFGFGAKYVWPDITTAGVEIRPEATPPTRFYDEFSHMDFLHPNLAAANPEKFDLVATNPTFAIAEKCLHQSIAMTKPGGYIAFLLDVGWQTSSKRATGVHKARPPAFVMPISPRPSFYWYLPEGASGETNYKHYNWFLWQKPEAGTAWGRRKTAWQPMVWGKLNKVEGAFKSYFDYLYPAHTSTMKSYIQTELA